MARRPTALFQASRSSSSASSLGDGPSGTSCLLNARMTAIGLPPDLFRELVEKASAKTHAPTRTDRLAFEAADRLPDSELARSPAAAVHRSGRPRDRAGLARRVLRGRINWIVQRR